MTIDPRTRIGHVHLTVSDLDRALSFYRDALGFEVTARYGPDAVFLSAGGYHHHIGLNTWAGRGAPPPPAGTTGLYHFAILFADRAALAAAVRRVLERGIPLEGASDHGVSEAVYLRELDANRRRLAGIRFGGVAHDPHEHIEQRIRIALDEHRLEGSREVEIDAAIAQQAPLQREAGTHHAHGVEATASTSGRHHAGTRAVTHRPQQLRRAVDVLEHLTEIVEQRQATIRGEIHPPADRFHRELQSGARGGQRIAGLMDLHGG